MADMNNSLECDDFMDNSSDIFCLNGTKYTKDYILEVLRGPKQIPLGKAVTFTLLNVLILVTGVVGNVLVCVVIIRRSSMHTVTNYYLFNLAVSDLTLLLLGKFNIYIRLSVKTFMKRTLEDYHILQ